MLQKKRPPNHHYADEVRPKKKKGKKGVLTSMTSHIKVKETEQEQEEGPEDGEISEVPPPDPEPRRSDTKKAEHNYVIANKIAVGQMPRRGGVN